jgi:fluoroquinolone transport system permease protein
MNKLGLLIKGEFQRLNRYNLTTISIVVAIIWIGLLLFLEDGIVESYLPFILFIDATMMSLLLVGAVMFYEKSESTISTMLVTPVSNHDLLLSKVIAYSIHNVFSSGMVILVFLLFRPGLELHLFILFAGLFLVTIIHSILGVVLSYFSKDFTSLLMNMMSYTIVLMIPTILLILNTNTNPIFDYINLINPLNASLQLVQAGINYDHVDWTLYFISLGYFLIAGPIGYLYYVKPKFQEYAIKQSGV